MSASAFSKDRAIRSGQSIKDGREVATELLQLRDPLLALTQQVSLRENTLYTSRRNDPVQNEFAGWSSDIESGREIIRNRLNDPTRDTNGAIVSDVRATHVAIRKWMQYRVDSEDNSSHILIKMYRPALG